MRTGHGDHPAAGRRIAPPRAPVRPRTTGRLRADRQRPQSLGEPQVLGVVDRHVDERRPVDLERPHRASGTGRRRLDGRKPAIPNDSA